MEETKKILQFRLAKPVVHETGHSAKARPFSSEDGAGVWNILNKEFNSIEEKRVGLDTMITGGNELEEDVLMGIAVVKGEDIAVVRERIAELVGKGIQIELLEQPI